MLYVVKNLLWPDILYHNFALILKKIERLRNAAITPAGSILDWTSINVSGVGIKLDWIEMWGLSGRLRHPEQEKILFLVPRSKYKSGDFINGMALRQHFQM